MNNIRYIVEFSFPDSHIEELDQAFEDLESAVRFGNGMLIQVKDTERFRRFDEDKRKPFFMVYEVCGGARKLVYQSK